MAKLSKSQQKSIKSLLAKGEALGQKASKITGVPFSSSGGGGSGSAIDPATGKNKTSGPMTEGVTLPSGEFLPGQQGIAAYKGASQLLGRTPSASEAISFLNTGAVAQAAPTIGAQSAYLQGQGMVSSALQNMQAAGVPTSEALSRLQDGAGGDLTARETIEGAKAPETQSVAIKSGDSLSVIAQRFGTSVDALLQANVGNPSVKNKNLIIAGGKINIPGAQPTTQQQTPTVPGTQMSATDVLAGFGLDIPSADELLQQVRESPAFIRAQEALELQTDLLKQEATLTKERLQRETQQAKERTENNLAASGLAFSGIRGKDVRELTERLTESEMSVDRKLAAALLDSDRDFQDLMLDSVSELIKEASSNREDAIAQLNKLGYAVVGEQLLKIPEKAQTTIRNVGGRTVLIDSTSGTVIKDIGPAGTTGGVPRSALGTYSSRVNQEVSKIYNGTYGVQGAREMAISVLQSEFPGQDIAEAIYRLVPDGWETRNPPSNSSVNYTATTIPSDIKADLVDDISTGQYELAELISAYPEVSTSYIESLLYGL